MSRPFRSALAAGLLAAAASAPAAAAPDADYAERVLSTLNTYRQSRGLAPLKASAALTALAAEHSAEMAGLNKPSHDGFASRFERTGGTLCVENVAQGFKLPEQVLSGWRGVPTHHRNVLEPRVTYAGVANTGLYVTYFACDLE
jgi:uncharacterized protein YkwD